MALITYDNAIEIAVSAYLGLHPSLRGERTYPREQSDTWKKDFHTKLDFIDHHVSSLQIPRMATRDEMVWVHQLRNELYHNQAALVPSVEDLDTARRASLWAFSVLFDVDADSLLQQPVSAPDPLVGPREAVLSKDTLFLENFVQFELLLNNASNMFHFGGGQQGRLVGAPRIWDDLVRRWQDMPTHVAMGVREAIEVRNRVAHGQPSGVSDEKLEGLSHVLGDAMNYLLQKMAEA